MELNPNIEATFVTTNSITHGKQVYPLWNELIRKFNIKINFAYKTFKWTSEATKKASVHVVIIGFSKVDRKNKVIFNDEQKKIVSKISPFLFQKYLKSLKVANQQKVEICF